MTSKHTYRTPRGVLVLVTLLALVFVAATAQAQRLNWRKLDPEFVPEGRDDHMMAFDSDHGYIVLFGGDNAGAGTWIWDGETWRDLDLEVNPAPRREAAMVYDTWRKRIVMFGGYDFTLLNNVTWQLDLETKEWNGQVYEESPTGRADFAMAFHEGIGLTILQGGDNSEGSTWAFDGEKWFTLVDEEDGPGRRWGHTMAYDSKRQRVVLFGGVSAINEILNDTWEFDGQQWLDVTPADGSPPRMRDHAMAYDSARGVTVVFGGRDAESEGFDQTWEWDGQSWREIITPDTPSPRHELQMAYDSRRRQIIMFGGSSGDLPDDRFKNDTWSYPNNPPVLEHTGLIGTTPGNDVTIMAEIVDYDDDQFDATLHYRTTGETAYQSVPMEPVMTFAESNTYSGTIPGAAVNEPGLEYYISATDPAGSGLTGYWRGPDAPWVVAVSETGRLQVFIEYGPARKNGAQWQVVGADAWHSHRDTVKLPPGEHEIRFSTVEGFTKPPRMIVTIVSGQKAELTGYYERK